MADLVLPPDHGTRYRDDVNRWARLYDRPGHDLPSPNYAAFVANIVTGLYQAQPPTVDPNTGPDAEDRLAYVVDLLEEGGERQAGMGLAVFRPSFDGTVWRHQVLDPTNIAPTWNHRRLVSAVVWTLHTIPDADRHDTKRVAVVEYWGTDRDGRMLDAPETVIAVGDVDDRGTFTAGSGDVYNVDGVPASYAQLPAVQGAEADRERADQPRQLVPVTWRWSRNMPVPIYYRNEGLITATEKLHDVEQTDAVMVRKRIAVSSDMLGRNAIRDSEGYLLAQPGFKIDQNVFLLSTPTGAMPESPDLPFHTIDWDDDLTQAERIQHRKAWILEHCGINPQSIGMSIAGRSDSAAAKRADQQMTMNTISTPARRLAAALTAVMTQENELNMSGGDVTVAVHEGLKPIPAEQVETAAAMDAADLGSTDTIVRTAQPGRSDEYYAEELARMEAEGRTASADEF